MVPRKGINSSYNSTAKTARNKMPFVPYHNSSGQQTLVNFGGLLTTEFLEPPPGRCFLFRQTYRQNVEGDVPDNLRKLIDSKKRPGGPPLHFHRYQTEYFRVEHGVMGLVCDGKTRIITPEDGEVSVKAGQIHRFFIHPSSPERMTVLLSASDSGNDYQLDRIFFENWYGYWHDALLHDKKGLKLLQFLAIYDGGDAYTPAPRWVPFRRTVGYWTCVALGRWVGGALGYKPFFKEYTTDWEYACEKMKGSFWQRRFAQKSWFKQKSWKEQVEMASGPKPLNAEYEQWLTQMSEAVKEKPVGVPELVQQPIQGQIPQLNLEKLFDLAQLQMYRIDENQLSRQVQVAS